MDVEVAARFAAVTSSSEAVLAAKLDEAALLMAAAGQGHDLDWVVGQLARLDGVAATCPVGLDGLCDHLFGSDVTALNLRGDDGTYSNPENSFLDRVLDRRLGIPITLGVLAMSIGRRVGVPLVGVGMPGHFLIRHEGLPRVLLDCFAGGRRLTSGDCALILERIYGPLPSFDLAWLNPTPAQQVIQRMLTNLRQQALATADVKLLGWVAPLRASLPGVGNEDLQLLAHLRAKLS